MQDIPMGEKTIMEKAIIINTTDLARLEGVIQKNIGAFYEVGKALMEIRDKELYKLKNGGDYQTFESYCKGVWDMTRMYAHYLISSASVVENVNHGLQIPTSERQARPLSHLEPDQQREAWQQAVSTAPDGKVTAAHVTKIVKSMTTKETVIEIPTIDLKPTKGIPSDAMVFAGMAISQLERIHSKDPQRDAAFEKVLAWIQNNQ
jgi:hypothetical protein